MKSEEYAETILHYQQCQMTLKRKNQMGDFKLAEEKLSTFVFQKLKKKICSLQYMENTQRGFKREHISVNNGNTLKNF
jgi:hypothetical protein